MTKKINACYNTGVATNHSCNGGEVVYMEFLLGLLTVVGGNLLTKIIWSKIKNYFDEEKQ